MGTVGSGSEDETFCGKDEQNRKDEFIHPSVEHRVRFSVTWCAIHFTSYALYH